MSHWLNPAFDQKAKHDEVKCRHRGSVRPQRPRARLGQAQTHVRIIQTSGVTRTVRAPCTCTVGESSADVAESFVSALPARLDSVSPSSPHPSTERLRAALAGLPKRQLHPGDAAQAGREGEEPDGGGHREGTGGVQRVAEGQDCKRRLKDEEESQRNNAAR